MSALIGSAVRVRCSAIVFADRAHVGGAAVGERLHGATEVVAIVGGHLLVAVEAGASMSVTSAGVQRRDVHHLEPRRCVAQQSMRAGDVTRGQHEAVGAVRERVDEIAQDVTQAREAFERAEFEHFIEQERARLAAGRRAVSKKASSASNASRALVGAVSEPCQRNGEVDVTAARNRSGVVAQRSTSMYWAALRPMRSLRRRSKDVRPVPHPPRMTGIREGVASSALCTPPIEPSWCTRHSTTPSFPSFKKATDLVADSLNRDRCSRSQRPHIFRHCDRNVKHSRSRDDCPPTSYLTSSHVRAIAMSE